MEKEKKLLIEFHPEGYIPPLPPKVDQWIDPKEYFSHFGDYYGLSYIQQQFNLDRDSTSLMYFNASKKRSYNNSKMGNNKESFKDHLCRYVNYFITYFDVDKEILGYYTNIKIMLDTQEYYYNDEKFLDELTRYFLSGSVIQKVEAMVNYNFEFHIEPAANMDKRLVYEDSHIKCLHMVSQFMLMTIPLLTHYLSKTKTIISVENFLLRFYDRIFMLFDIDLRKKLLATSEYEVSKSAKKDQRMWQQQDIRGISEATHATYNLIQVIICVIPKYVFDQYPHNLNNVAIKQNIKNFVVGLKWEFKYCPVAKMVDDKSDFNLLNQLTNKNDESKTIYAHVNSKYVINKLTSKYHIPDELVDFYYEEYTRGNYNPFTPFQKEIIFYTFYKYYGDTISINNIDIFEYIRLMLISKEILNSEKKFLLSEIISAKVTSMSNKKNINKKEKKILEDSEIYTQILDKYSHDPTIIDKILNIVASIVTSRFEVIDPRIDESRELVIVPEILKTQLLEFILLI